MKKIVVALALLGIVAAIAPANAHIVQCRWEWNGNGYQQICR
jgi:hypothetical protein